MARSGTYVNNLSGMLTYQSFRPSNLPPNPPIKLDDEQEMKLKKAYLLLGELNGVSQEIKNKDLFLSIYIRKEALLSSQIEGTQATLDDIFDPRIDTNTNLDVEEVVNYLKAYRYADARLDELPISTRFIKEIHLILLEGRRGYEKEPGNIRKTQNWIGGKGSTLQNARYIPPNVSDMYDALGKLELFIHESDNIDPLVKIALIHYQFETIHPFLDGNGRIGRLLISILLKQYGLIKEDVFYLSYFLKQNRSEYYDRLNDVRKKGFYEQWISFFLEAVITTCQHAIKCIHDLKTLRNTNLELISNLEPRKKKTTLLLLEHLESHPIVTIETTSKALNKSFGAISNAIKTLMEIGLVNQTSTKERYRVFSYEPYLNILRDGTELS